MKNIPRFIVLTFSIILLGFSICYPQAEQKRNPYEVGEVLSYDGKISKSILRGISVAELTFTVSQTADKSYLVKADANSKGSLIKLIGFRFTQNFVSTIDRERFTILKTVKHDEQGNRVRESEAVFDYPNATVTYVETDPKDTTRPPRKIASTIESETHDLISGIYLLRYLPLAVGKTFEVNISDSGLVYKIPIRVTAREQQNTVLGKIWCFRVEPDVFGNGRLIEQNGKMVIWVTDDNRQIPVRSQISVNIGKIDVKLRKIIK